jgi:hypothetical protein
VPEFQHADKRLNLDFDLTHANCIFTRREASPITRLERPIAASTFECQMAPDVFFQFMRQCSLIERMDKSRWAGAVVAVDPGAAPCSLTPPGLAKGEQRSR